MKILYCLGCFLLALAAVLLGREAYLAYESGGYRLVSTGETWFLIDRALGTGSLNVSQAVVQRYVWPWFWEGVVQNLLLCPAWAVAGVPGLLLLLAGRLGRRRTP